MTNSLYVAVMKIIMLPSCPYFIFIDASTSKHEDIFIVIGFSLYIDIYCIMDCYVTLCHNTYGYSLLFYKGYIRRENAGSWNSGLEKEQILETYSAQLQKS